MGLDLQKTPVAGTRMDFDALLRRCARWDYSVSSNRLLDARSGSACIPCRTSRSRSATRATTCSPTPDRRRRRARVRAELGIEPGQRAVLYAPTHREYQADYVAVLDVGARRRRARAGPRAAGPRALLLWCRPAAARAAPPRAASATSRRTPRSRSCAWRRTCWSRTTRRSCSTTPCSTARSSSTPPTGRRTGRSAAPTSTCSRSRPGPVTRDAARAGRGRSHRAPCGARPPRVARRLPRPLLRARGRPRRRARRAPRLARRARAGAAPARGGHAVSAPGERRLILVVGVGRSGTSLLAGHPRPARAPHPAARGQGRRHEPARLRRAALGGRLPHPPAASSARVTVNDSRPPRGRRPARRPTTPRVRDELREWLGARARRARRASSSRTRAPSGSCRCGPRCAARARGAAPSFVTMLRHPAEIVASARKSYGTWQTTRAARRPGSTSSLETEHATRGDARAFIRYDDLLADWRARDPPHRQRCSTLPQLAPPDERARCPRSTRSSTRRCTATASRWDELDVPAAAARPGRGRLGAAPAATRAGRRRRGDRMRALDAARDDLPRALRGGGGDRAVLDHRGQARAGQPPRQAAAAAVAARARSPAASRAATASARGVALAGAARLPRS